MTDQPTINVPLLRKVLEHITAHPEEHNQAVWGVRTQCSTAYCLAGHALVMSGVDLRWSEPAVEGGYATTDYTVRGEEIYDAAADLLGLTRRQADDLFCPDNTQGRLWQLAHSMSGGEIQRPVTS